MLKPLNRFHTKHASAQRGSMLIEALIAILLFSMGILGLLGLQAAALKNTADAKYRSEASFFANQIIGQMWAGNPALLGTYQHRPGGTTCNFSGAASTNANVTAWLNGNIALAPYPPGTLAGTLPGADGPNMHQITIGGGNVVTVTVCWQGPRETLPHSFVSVAQIN